MTDYSIGMFQDERNAYCKELKMGSVRGEGMIQRQITDRLAANMVKFKSPPRSLYLPSLLV